VVVVWWLGAPFGVMKLIDESNLNERNYR